MITQPGDHFAHGDDPIVDPASEAFDVERERMRAEFGLDQARPIMVPVSLVYAIIDGYTNAYQGAAAHLIYDGRNVLQSWEQGERMTGEAMISDLVARISQISSIDGKIAILGELRRTIEHEVGK